jgi:hypothetical protein
MLCTFPRLFLTTYVEKCILYLYKSTWFFFFFFFYGSHDLITETSYTVFATMFVSPVNALDLGMNHFVISTQK